MRLRETLIMLRESKMDFVLENFKSYLSAIEEYQSGSKLGEDSDNLDMLDDDLKSRQDLSAQSKINPEYVGNSFTGFVNSISEVSLIEGVIPYSEFTKVRSEEHTSELQSRGHLVC